MNQQTLAFYEASSTLLTLVRPVPRVDLEVASQVGSVRKLTLTVLARVLGAFVNGFNVGWGKTAFFSTSGICGASFITQLFIGRKDILVGY